MLSKAVEWNYLNQIPKIKLLKEEKKPPRFLSNEEMEVLLECSSPWLTPILLVLRNTGFRTRELINLKWEDIDLNRNLLLVRNNKGNSYHTISMNEELKTALLFLRDNYVRHDGKIILREAQQMVYVFCHPNGKPIKSFKRSFYNAVRKAGLNNVSPHVIRHSVASNLVMEGVDLRAIQHLLGHKDISTTMIYAHVSSEHIAKSLDKLTWAKPKLKLASE